MKVYWNDIKLKKRFFKIKNDLQKEPYKYKDYEMESYYLDYLSHQTKSNRIMRMITLAYYLGRLREIAFLDDCKNKVTLD